MIMIRRISQSKLKLKRYRKNLLKRIYRNMKRVEEKLIYKFQIQMIWILDLNNMNKNNKF